MRFDRVEWPAIFAGIFAAVSLLIVLSVLGVAIGLSSYDSGDSSHSYAIGAGWWAAISAVIAFAFGGWFAARTSAPSGNSSGLVNGAMVWAVAVPLLLLLAGGMASMAGGAAAVDASRQNALTQPRQNPSGGAISDEARPAGARFPGPMTPSTDTGAHAAWGTLISLVLGLAGAAAGGYLGAGSEEDRRLRPASPGNTNGSGIEYPYPLGPSRLGIGVKVSSRMPLGGAATGPAFFWANANGSGIEYPYPSRAARLPAGESPWRPGAHRGVPAGWLILRATTLVRGRAANDGAGKKPLRG